jgi:cyclic beta-1,2-glucan synthetase
MCGFHHDSEALLAHNRFRPEYAERVAFLVSSERAHGLTADRREFLGSHTLVTVPPGPSGVAAWPVHIPEALLRIGLSGNIEPGVDPCAALQVHIDLGALETKTLHFALGDGANLDEARRLATESRPHAAAERALQAGQEFWETTLGRAQVSTPDPALDLMLNRWLPYQTLACRIWGRTALYQSSGAYGFRDQLQDVSSLLWLAPQLAREHLLRAAAHQFQEGDVLHWWHPPTDAGVRTRIADDLLWLPYAVARYVRWTGDRSVLSEVVGFLIGPEPKEASDLYARFETAGDGTLLDHCLRALRRGATAGRTGLPLFASGDWNDGMNRVGEKGEGESVWLAWFLFAVLRDFADLIAHDDPDTARELRERAQALAAAAEASAWDGAWYLRGTFDDGTPLGSSASVEARIDAIAQSWAVISGGADHARAERAMESVREELLRREAGVLLLLAPPFTHSKPDPGYIGAYPPGVRENGGQYTHAAAWAGIAWALLGHTDLAHEVFGMLTPVRRTSTQHGSDLYRGEPYVVAADVYGVAPHMGRAGWTWYTGAAGWLYRLGLETILGLRMENGAVVVEPRLPSGWDEFTVTLQIDGEPVALRVKSTGEWEAGTPPGQGRPE